MHTQKPNTKTRTSSTRRATHVTHPFLHMSLPPPPPPSPSPSARSVACLSVWLCCVSVGLRFGVHLRRGSRGENHTQQHFDHGARARSCAPWPRCRFNFVFGSSHSPPSPSARCFALANKKLLYKYIISTQRSFGVTAAEHRNKNQGDREQPTKSHTCEHTRDMIYITGHKNVLYGETLRHVMLHSICDSICDDMRTQHLICIAGASARSAHR